jgi:UDP-N-acetylmuramyl tripeptide synthase
MSKKAVITIGKTARAISRLRGGGSALPGLIVEKLDPHFLKHALEHLPRGVVIISGTNGKTTTTKMVVALLESQGLKVFTNPTGSNFKRGIISAIIEKSKLHGKLDYDIAVLELDEAHAVHFVRDIKPSYCLLLNVMRDQLDRFGEIDATAVMLKKIAQSTTKGIVLNRDDPRVNALALDNTITTSLCSFGVSPQLKQLFPSDDELYGAKNSRGPIARVDDVSLESVDGHNAVITYGGKQINVSLKLTGVYNILNAAAAIALVRLVAGKELDEKALFSALENVTPAFGRGENLVVNDQPLELILVKNPSGFRLGLSSFDSKNTSTMIAINDNYADGRDMSWLWDVDFSSLQPAGVAMVTGIRAYDMALRLEYDEVAIKAVTPHLKTALRHFIKENPHTPKRIFCTYTAMLHLRRELKKYTKVERAL